MFNSDKPITKIEDDVLNRGNFSKQLAHAILAYTKTDNFVIILQETVVKCGIRLQIGR